MHPLSQYQNNQIIIIINKVFLKNNNINCLLVNDLFHLIHLIVKYMVILINISQNLLKSLMN